MKFSCTQENLNQALVLASHLATKDVNLPILSNILIKDEAGVLVLVSTNLEMGVRCEVRGKVEGSGSFTVPARVLSEYVALLPRDRVDMELQENTVQITCGANQTKIKGEPATEFPLIPAVERQVEYQIDANELLVGIQQVVFAAATSESRPEIAGVLFYFKPEAKQLILAATDSYRLSEKQLKLVGGAGVERRIIVPTRTLQEVQRALAAMSKEKDGEAGLMVTVAITENQIVFNYQNWELISRIVEGQYPDYHPIIPAASATQVVVAVGDLLKATKSASLFSQTGVNDVFLRVMTDKNEIAVSSTNTQVGENTSGLPAAITGKDNEVVLNHRYLIDGLNAIDTPEALLELVDNNTPVIIRPTRMDTETPRDHLYLVMPIKQ